MAQLSHNLIGQSSAWLVTLDRISALAAIEKPVLVVGERGTGKTVVADRLHFLSKRWEQSWQAVNCAAMDAKGLDAEIFGGASFTRTSLLERAEGGTLFIDAIEAMPLRLQAKLLQTLESGEYTPPDQEAAVKTDIRILAACHLDLQARAQAGLFNGNLIDILAFDVITLPPLRARKSDVLLLAEHFATRMVAELDEDSFAGFSAEVLEFLTTYDWPGNVRQLKTAVERAVGRAWNEDGGLSAPIAQMSIDPFEAPWKLPEGGLTEGRLTERGLTEETSKFADKAVLPNAGVETNTGVKTRDTDFTRRSDAFELSIITEALAQTKNHQGKAAKYLGLTYHQFRGLLRKHGLKK